MQIEYKTISDVPCDERTKLSMAMTFYGECIALAKIHLNESTNPALMENERAALVTLYDRCIANAENCLTRITAKYGPSIAYSIRNFYK